MVLLTWTYDPEKIHDNPKDQVRFLIGDVIDAEQLVQDEEIEFALSKGRNIYMAAAMLCDGIAAMFSRQVDSKTGDVEDKFSQRAAAFAKRAEELRKEGNSGALATAKPLAGGINVFEKQMAEKNPSRVRPFFSRNQFRGQL